MFPHLERLFARLWIQQVMHFLVVDFHVGHLDLIGQLFGLLGRNRPEQLVAQPRDDAFVLLVAHHGVGLSGPGLAVGKYARVVALEGIVQDVAAHVGEHQLLGGEVVRIRVRRVETVIECEYFWRFSAIKSRQEKHVIKLLTVGA